MNGIVKNKLEASARIATAASAGDFELLMKEIDEQALSKLNRHGKIQGQAAVIGLTEDNIVELSNVKVTEVTLTRDCCESLRDGAIYTVRQLPTTNVEEEEEDTYVSDNDSYHGSLCDVQQFKKQKVEPCSLLDVSDNFVCVGGGESQGCIHEENV